MGSIDDAMNVVTSLFLEIVSDVSLITYLKGQPPHKLKLDVINLIKRHRSIYIPEYFFRKSQVTRLIKSLINFICEKISFM